VWTGPKCRICRIKQYVNWNIFLYWITLKTRTHDTNITSMTAMNQVPSHHPWWVQLSALKWSLWTWTPHVVQPGLSRPLSIPPKSYSFGKTKLSTCNLGVVHVKARITHCSPLAIVVDSYNTSNTWTCCTRFKLYIICWWNGLEKKQSNNWSKVTCDIKQISFKEFSQQLGCMKCFHKKEY